MGWSLGKWLGSNFDPSLEIKTFFMGGGGEDRGQCRIPSSQLLRIFRWLAPCGILLSCDSSGCSGLYSTFLNSSPSRLGPQHLFPSPGGECGFLFVVECHSPGMSLLAVYRHSEDMYVYKTFIGDERCLGLSCWLLKHVEKWPSLAQCDHSLNLDDVLWTNRRDMTTD